MELHHFTSKPVFIFANSFDESDHPDFVNFCSKLTAFVDELSCSDEIDEAVKKFDHHFKNLNKLMSFENLNLLKCLVLSLKNHSQTARFYKKSTSYFTYEESTGRVFSFTDSAFLEGSDKKGFFESHELIEISLHNIIHEYFDDLCSFYLKEKKFLSLKKAQTFMIQFYPKDIKWLARRGLTHKHLGSYTEALKDLELYVSLHDHIKIFNNHEVSLLNSAKEALIDLQGVKRAKKPMGQAFH